MRHLAIPLLLVLTLSTGSLPAAAETVPFDSDRWVLRGGEVTEHLGRPAFAGFATLEDVVFTNGTLEVDVAVSGETSYPGLNFRIQDAQNYERLYIRPHRIPRYGDGLQYTPVIRGIAGWQLYNGDGFTAGARIPRDAWFHLRIEVSGNQARIYVGDATTPDLAVIDLKHGVSTGAIGVMCPTDGTAYFSNFTYDVDDALHIDEAPPPDTPPGFITDWELSQLFKLNAIDLEASPEEQDLDPLAWRSATPDPSGLIDIARYQGREGREPDVILARTTLHADQAKTFHLRFGYSDAMSVFLNGEMLFFGNSGYRQRDSSFLGIVGLNDALYLPLRRGANELLLMIAEGFGGWGFLCQDGEAVYLHATLERAFESEADFLTPESILYDPARRVLYVSNYDVYNRAALQGGQSISRVRTDGEIDTLHWVRGLRQPTGLALRGNTLLAVDRGGWVEIDIESAEITTRHTLEGAVFPNDIAVDAAGNAYISDSSGSVIYRVRDGEAAAWLSGDAIANPNALYVHRDELLIGNNGDNCLKAAHLDSQAVRTIVQLPPGIIDGIRVDRDGNYLVSHWEGRLYRIAPDGSIVKLLDTTVPTTHSADFEYVESQNLLVIPNFMEDRITGYRLGS